MATAEPLSLSARRRLIFSRGLIATTTLVAAGFLSVLVLNLYREWQGLKHEEAGERNNRVIGYLNISPEPSLARPPANWVRDEGDSTLIWSGWTPGVGHGWFRVGRGEIDRARLGWPLGRDTIRAIDLPIVEIGGGSHWDLIPHDTPVFALEIAGMPCVYPLRLLQKVEVVNDQVGDRPFLVVFTPFRSVHESVEVFDPMVEGQRVTMGHTGHLMDRQPLLYDRPSESLWAVRASGLQSVAGLKKGQVLKRLAQVPMIYWSEWLARHPRSRLLVGAERPNPRPAE